MRVHLRIFQNANVVFNVIIHSVGIDDVIAKAKNNVSFKVDFKIYVATNLHRRNIGSSNIADPKRRLICRKF